MRSVNAVSTSHTPISGCRGLMSKRFLLDSLLSSTFPMSAAFVVENSKSDPRFSFFRVFSRTIWSSRGCGGAEPRALTGRDACRRRSAAKSTGGGAGPTGRLQPRADPDGPVVRVDDTREHHRPFGVHPVAVETTDLRGVAGRRGRVSFVPSATSADVAATGKPDFAPSTSKLRHKDRVDVVEVAEMEPVRIGAVCDHRARPACQEVQRLD